MRVRFTAQPVVEEVRAVSALKRRPMNLAAAQRRLVPLDGERSVNPLAVYQLVSDTPSHRSFRIINLA